jgi:hypothetical protein
MHFEESPYSIYSRFKGVNSELIIFKLIMITIVKTRLARHP